MIRKSKRLNKIIMIDLQIQKKTDQILSKFIFY